MKQLLALACLATLMPACHGGRPSSSPMAPSASQVTYTVSGVVSALTPDGLKPVEGVRVEESISRRSAMTDKNGFYLLAGLFAASNTFSVSKFGYDTQSANVTIHEDTRLDIRLTQVTTFTISGVVFEQTAAGRTPLENVDLYCDSCGEIGVGHTFTRTDTNGHYTFVGVFAGNNPIQVSKAGYQYPDGQLIGSGSPQWYMRQVSVVGDTRLDIELVRK
jgi:hypothetical protein